MALPTTGATWATVLEPSLNPLAVRYWQVTDVLIRDYFNADGTVFNLADPSVGLGSEGLFTPFAADNLTIRKDLLLSAPGTNLGFLHMGLLKEDTTASTPDQTIQETPSAQILRTVRNVLTKLDDKLNFTPIEASPLVDFLNFEKPLQNVPAVGTPGYQNARDNADMLQERVVVLLGVDTDGQLLAKVYPRVVTDKKGKTELQRKNPESLELTYSVLPDPYSKKSMWICRAGAQWLASGDLAFETTAPVATPVSGLKANVQFPTPIDVTSPVYTAQISQAGAFSAGTVAASPTVSGAFTTIQLTGLTASTLYDGVQVTATGSNVTATSLVSNSFTSLAS